MIAGHAEHRAIARRAPAGRRSVPVRCQSAAAAPPQCTVEVVTPAGTSAKLTCDGGSNLRRVSDSRRRPSRSHGAWRFLFSVGRTLTRVTTLCTSMHDHLPLPQVLVGGKVEVYSGFNKVRPATWLGVRPCGAVQARPVARPPARPFCWIGYEDGDHGRP